MAHLLIFVLVKTQCSEGSAAVLDGVIFLAFLSAPGRTPDLPRIIPGIYLHARSPLAYHRGVLWMDSFLLSPGPPPMSCRASLYAIQLDAPADLPHLEPLLLFRRFRGEGIDQSAVTDG